MLGAGVIPPLVLETKGLCKYFGNLKANQDLNLDLRKNEVHVILGENGAGKSTFVKMLYGLYKPSGGQIFVQGQEVVFNNAHEAINCGIGMVNQHFLLLDNFSVLENIVLGQEPSRFGFLDLPRAYQELKQLIRYYGFEVDLKTKVKYLSLEAKQRVEILKVLYRKADVLIFDEPTAVLSPSEIERFALTLQTLTKKGKSVFLITHKLSEILQMGNRCTILRRGQWIDTIDITPKLSTMDLSDKMVGHRVLFEFDAHQQVSSNGRAIVLEVKDLNLQDKTGHHNKVQDLNFSLYEGEILGVAGIEGNGQVELARALTGLYPVAQGDILFEGHSLLPFSAKEIHQKGISHIPEDRHKGVLLDHSVANNVILHHVHYEPYQYHGFLNFQARDELAQQLTEDFEVYPPDYTLPIKNLSGGNQQKVIVARETFHNPKVVVAVYPTRGVDVAMVHRIYTRFIELKENHGTAIVLISSELEELLAVCDRILVMARGHGQGIVRAKHATLRELGSLMGGVSHG